MDSQFLSEKLALIQWLSTVEDKSIIKKLTEFKNRETKDWWGLISEEEKSSIEKGLEEADKKDLSPHSDARKLYEKWL